MNEMINIVVWAKRMLEYTGYKVVPVEPVHSDPTVEDERPQKDEIVTDGGQYGWPPVKKECQHEWRRHHQHYVDKDKETWDECKKCEARQHPETGEISRAYSPEAARAYIKAHIQPWMRDVGYRVIEVQGGGHKYHYCVREIMRGKVPFIIITDESITVCSKDGVYSDVYIYSGTDPAAAFEAFKKVVEPLKPQLLKKLFEQKLGGEWEIDTCVIRNKGDRFCWYNHVCMDYTLGIGCRVIENQPPSDFVTAFKKAHPTITYTFKECPECAKKTGHPVLCPSCLHNRSVIEDLLQKIKGLE